MLTMLKNWNGSVEVDGTSFDNIEKAISCFKPSSETIHIVLRPREVRQQNAAGNTVREAATKQQYRVSVKRYMTQQSSPEFDFMEKWNNNVPMPLRTMIGTVEKETRGMVYMKLHGDISGRVTQCCLRCGKQITNPISQLFGMGPECGGHNYVNPFRSDEELQEAVEKYRREYLQNIKWEGWIIRSAITEWEEV